MAVFGFGKDKKDPGNNQEQILAYLEEAQRNRAAFTLSVPRKPGIAATLQSLDEGQGRITFQVQQLLLGAEKGVRMDFSYIADNLRLVGSCRLVEVRPGVVQAELPAALELKERRSQPRARLNPKEGCTLTALTGLFDGVGITGAVENLSEGGARVRVEKAMNLKGEKRLPLGTALVPAGQPFMLIKLNKAPKCPGVMELEGRAVYLDNGPGGLVMGVAFGSLKSDQASAIRSLVGSRTTAVPSSLPAKTRRRPEAQAAPDPAPVPAAPPAPVAAAPAPVPAAPAAVPEPKPVTERPAASAQSAQVAPKAQAQAPVEAPEAAAPRNEALVRMKMRSRAVVALASSPAQGDLLKAFLQDEGFGRILVSDSPKELLGFLQQPNLAVLLVDGDFSTLDALQFLTQLKAIQPDMPPVILAVEAVSTGLVLAAHRQGVTQMLVKPYALDQALSDLLIQQL